jgi:exonuclease SbcC
MLYRRIKAINFLGHVETEIRFDGYNAIVVVGKNGAGKSSFMIDAPLVALFGKGRSGDLDGYIRNGKDMMQVEFDFSIGDEIYGAVRKRSKKTARGTSSVDFYQLDSSGNITKDLTAGSIAETDAVIRRTLGTDFDTLVRASIIEQGEADFFCNASPSERMELFSKVWDLEKYDEWCEMARDKVKGAKERIKAIEEIVSSNQKKIWEFEENGKELDGLKKSAKKEAAVVSGLEDKKGELQKKMAVFDGYDKQLKQLREFSKSIDDQLKKINELHTAVLGKISRFEKILNNREVVLQKVEEEKVAADALSSLEAESVEFGNEIDELRAEQKKLRDEAQAKIDEIAAEKARIDEEIEKTRKVADAVNKKLSGIGRKEEQLKQMCVDADKLKGVQCHPEFDPAYVNETCRFIKDAVIAKKNIPEFEKAIAAEKKTAEFEIAELDKKAGELARTKADCDVRIKAIRSELDEKLVGYEKRIDGCRQSRGACQAQIEKKRTEIEELKRFTKLAPEISLAEQELPGLKKEERDHAERYAKLSSEKGKYTMNIEEITTKLSGKAVVERELQLVCNQLEQSLSKKDELTKKIGFIEAGLEQVKDLNEAIKKYDAESANLETDRAVYQILEDAFRQIPFMLVSRGIGAVESTANQILSLISSSGLTISIHTEKMTKTTKKLRDEIHLVIADADGEKGYKFLSGGEKLRVALALRLAIGEVFAHRRGVSIESLLADEPFGPLDDEGVDDMKEAMKVLRERFRFMGVITHIKEAMNIFPTRLVFERQPGKGATALFEEEYV